MSIMGMKVSKIGYPVETTGNENLSFSSELATHSIFNVVSLNKASGNSSVSYSHNLGYIPKTWIFLRDTSGEEYLRRIPIDGWATSTSIDYYVTSSQIVIETESAATEYDFEVIIFTRSPNP